MSSLQRAVSPLQLGGGVEGLLTLLRRILRRPRVQSVTITSSEIRTEFVGEPNEELLVGAAEDNELYGLYALVRAAPMDSMGEAGAPLRTFYRIFQQLQQDGLRLRGFMVGESSLFWAWAGLRAYQREVLGHPVYQDDHLPDDRFLVLGSLLPDTDLSLVERTYTVFIPTLITEVDL